MPLVGGFPFFSLFNEPLVATSEMPSSRYLRLVFRQNIIRIVLFALTSR